MSKKPDLRVIRTKKLLWEALVGLIEERDFSTITISDITARAMTNRATFYHHYEDKEDLLRRGTAEVIRHLTEEITAIQATRAADDFGPVQRSLVVILDHVDEHTEFYRVMLSTQATGALRQEIQDMFDEFILRKLASLPSTEYPRLVPDMLTARTVSSVIIGLLTWWIESGKPFPKETLIEYYLKLMVLGAYRCLGLEPPARSF